MAKCEFCGKGVTSVLRFLTLTDVPTEPGSPTSSALRLLSTVLRAMCTLVPDASAPTRLSGQSNYPCILTALHLQCCFYFIQLKFAQRGSHKGSLLFLDLLFYKLGFGGVPPLAMRAWCGAFRSCPDPLGIVPAEVFVKLELVN